MESKLSRRQFLKTSAGIALTASSALERFGTYAEAEGSAEEVDLAVVKSASPEAAVIAAIEVLGGMGKFVKSGDAVVIKPNMAFPNPSAWATTTNPEVVSTIAKLCLDSGARLVLIIDHPQARPEQCLERTGVAAVCKKLKSKKVRVSMEMERRNYKEVTLEKARALKKTDVHKALLRADVFINIPVAKSHSATEVSFSMKNLMGLIWDRAYIHQQIDLHQGIADLSTFIKPSLVVVDGTRILTTRGPQGPGSTIKLNTVIAGADPVAADSYAVTLSHWNGRRYAPKDIKHIAAANAMQLGEMDLNRLNIREMEI